jgi:hypothetical protein
LSDRAGIICYAVGAHGKALPPRRIGVNNKERPFYEFSLRLLFILGHVGVILAREFAESLFISASLAVRGTPRLS